MQWLKKIAAKGLFFTFILMIMPTAAGHTAQQEATSKGRKPVEEVAKTDNSKPDDKNDQGYLYDPTGKTDPFKSFIAIREEAEAKEKQKPKTYLETLELSQLDLIVIMISPKGKWAMVKDSKGLGHVIKEGTPIGTNGGVVEKIGEGEVVIREEFTDFRGRKQTREIVKKTPSVR